MRPMKLYLTLTPIYPSATQQACEDLSNANGGSKNTVATEANESEEPQKKRTMKSNYMCEQCNKGFTYKCHIDNHKKIHTGDKTLKCKECDYTCTLPAYLTRHMKIHSTDKPFLCDKCSFRTAIRRDIERHERIHTGEKPYACTICDYRSANSTTVKYHIKSHYGETTHSCTHCDYKCIGRGKLKRHLQKHSGELRYSCILCSYKCRERFQMSKHRRQHMQADSMFTCSFCDNQYISPRLLKAHLKTHQIQEEPVAAEPCDSEQNVPDDSGVHDVANSDDGRTNGRATQLGESPQHRVQPNIIGHVAVSQQILCLTCPHCSFACPDHTQMQTHMALHFTGSQCNGIASSNINKYISYPPPLFNMLPLT